MGEISNQLHPVLVEDYQRLRNALDVGALRGTQWLITGATGFVPAYLVKFLCWLNQEESLGMKLRLWVRSEEKARAMFPFPGFAHIEVPDWMDPEQWNIPAADYIIHAASPATPAACRVRKWSETKEMILTFRVRVFRMKHTMSLGSCMRLYECDSVFSSSAL